MPGLNGKRYHSLPDVYTQRTMLVGTASIFTAETLKTWPYLDKTDILEIHTEVELLIGTNASAKLLEPWGWVVSGSYENCKYKHENNCHVATVNSVSGASGVAIGKAV